MKHTRPPSDQGPFPITISKLPTLAQAGLTGSYWHSEGQPVFAANNDTSDLWPILIGAGISLVVNPHDGRLFRTGGKS